MDSREPPAPNGTGLRSPRKRGRAFGSPEDVERALDGVLDARDVLPLLHRLARTAPAGSEESLFAHRQLAELVADRHPWRGAIYARRVLAHCPDDDRAWAVLALCQTILGNYRYAVTAYRHALAAAPKNPWYAHNLGHLLDVALGRPEEALPWLRAAYATAPWSGEIVVSLAHALARAGKISEAKRVLGRAGRGQARPSREQMALMDGLEAGAPEAALERGAAPRLGAGTEPTARPSRRRARRAALAEVLDEALARGLAHLPLGAPQRTVAVALAREAAVRAETPTDEADMRALAAAVAYAAVFVEKLPLTPGEVAASFRVSVAAVRLRFGELRTRLALVEGDERYRSAVVERS